MTGREAYEVVGHADEQGPFLFTCEHGSNHIPDDAVVSLRDRQLLQEHWGWDIGARDVVRSLVGILGGQGVISSFSRLWIDPNRDTDADSLIVCEVDGQAVDFNAEVDERERQRRIDGYFEPYHQAIDRVGRARTALAAPVHLLSIHSFTPLYLGLQRPMEIGVLFDDFDEDAWHLEEALSQQGFVSALNAPYSGKGPAGLIYAAERHGHALAIKYLELEIRQDLIDTPDKAHAVAERLGRALEVFRPASE